MKFHSAFIVSGSVLALTVINGLLITPIAAQNITETTTYQCSPSEKIIITPIPGSNPATLTVTLPDQRTVNLAQDVSASGAKYTNGNVTFWSKGNTALVEEGGTIKWRDCVKL